MLRNHTSRAHRRGEAALADVFIPDKLYFRIGEVSKLTHTKAYVLRYWETEFPMLRPAKSSSGHRLYRKRDVEMVIEIRKLLYAHGFTIEGARNKLGQGGKPEKGNSRQKPLFSPAEEGPAVERSHLRSIRHELQGILTILRRKC
jgi:DNA-binding transcriptional MerR regulator